MFKICHNFKKITVCLLWAGMLAGCKTPAPEPEPVEADPLSAASLINLQDPNMIRTPKAPVRLIWKRRCVATSTGKRRK